MYPSDVMTIFCVTGLEFFLERNKNIKKDKRAENIIDNPDKVGS